MINDINYEKLFFTDNYNVSVEYLESYIKRTKKDLKLYEDIVKDCNAKILDIIELLEHGKISHNSQYMKLAYEIKEIRIERRKFKNLFEENIIKVEKMEQFLKIYKENKNIFTYENIKNNKYTVKSPNHSKFVNELFIKSIEENKIKFSRETIKNVPNFNTEVNLKKYYVESTIENDFKEETNVDNNNINTNFVA